MSLKDLVNDAMDQFNIPTTTRCKLFDSTGYELTEDDVDFLDDSTPLFFSAGEPFMKTNSFALY
jgi:hypothetical protein